MIRTCNTPKYVEKLTCKPDGTAKGVVVEVEYIDGCNCLKKSMAIETFDHQMLVPVNGSAFCFSDVYKAGSTISLRYECMSHAYKSSFGIPIRLIKVFNYKPLVRIAEGMVEYKDGYYRLLDTSADIEVSLILDYVAGHPNVGILNGETLSIRYIDIGEETEDRCGIPIAVLEYDTL
jgi:hypothetical protein